MKDSGEYQETLLNLIKVAGVLGEELEEARSSARAWMDVALDAVIIIDIQGVIKAWNPQAEVTFGWREDEVLGRELVNVIIPERFREAHLKGLDHYRNLGEGPILQKRLRVPALRRSGEEFPVELAISPAKMMAETVFVGFIRDLSETSQSRYEDVITLE
jgi:PAS domain S-box-containing protein